MAKDKDRDIDAVRRAETQRGRKQPRPQGRLLTRLDQLFEEGGEEELANALIARGWRRGTPQFDEALNAFRIEQQRRQSQS